ncbi:MAG: hypothetical protein ACR2G3_10755 [Solirubrobacterales bacterium]
MSIQPPQFLVDVFRDLRDRRLLIPAGALLVALVAVPMLLSRSEAPAPPPLAEVADATAVGAATEPAVLAENVTVRDYERRLDDLKEKNPFTEQFQVPPSDGGGLAGDGGGLAGSGLGGAQASGGGDESPSGGGPIASDSDSAINPSDVQPTSSPPTSSSPPKPPRIETRYFTWRIDVLTGPVGSAVERNGVGQLSLLPSKSKPVVVFLGITQSGKDAVFAVSNDATTIDTTGSCEPSPANCAYVVLERGQGATFDYAPDGVTYRLALKGIKRVPISKPGTLDGKF